MHIFPRVTRLLFSVTLAQGSRMLFSLGYGARSMRRAPDAGASGSGGGGTAAQAQESPYRDEKRSAADRFSPNVESQFQSFLARYGTDVTQAARYMWSELYTVRRRNRALKDESDALKTRFPQGSVALIGDDVARYNAYKALGTPDDIKAKLDSATKIERETIATQRKATRTEAAQLLKFHAGALADRLDLSLLDVEIKEQTKDDGSKARVPHVRKTGDANATWEPLAIVAERDWKEYLPALRAAPASSSAANGAAPSADTPFVDFHDNGAAGAGNTSARGLVDSFITRRDEQIKKTPNPLGAASGQRT